MEIGGFEEPNPLATAKVAQQEHLPFGLMLFDIVGQILHKLEFAFIQAYGHDGNLPGCLDMEQWLEKMPVKIDALDSTI